MWRVRILVLVVSTLVVVAGCSRQSDGKAESAGGSGAAAAVPTVVVLDASESMTTDDVSGSRWSAAKKATQTLVDSLPDGTETGLVVFGAEKPWRSTAEVESCQDVRVVMPLGRAGPQAVTSALDRLAPQGRTPIGTALQEGARLLPNTAASLVLISDGESNCAPDPCETAAQIRADKPQTRISAVGLRTDADSLRCIADKGDGVFLTADNAAQLTARLAAAQNVDEAKSKLTPEGLGEARIGQRLDEVVAANPGFPSDGRREGDRIVIVWKDCTYVFDAQRTLIEIAPGSPAGATGVTVDGVKAGTPGSRAVELYGTPADDSDGVATFVADEKAGTGYRIGYRDGASIGEGTVTTVVLCRCAGDAPGHGEPVLGRDKFEQYATGFGTVRPSGISIASTAASTVGDITWQSWGGAEAVGTGLSQQNGAHQPRSTTYLRAADVGWCDGVWAYRSLHRSSTRGSGRVTDDICKGDRRAPTAKPGGVTLSPSSLLTFGGAGGVYLGDPASKIPPHSYEWHSVSDGRGTKPAGTQSFYFSTLTGSESAPRVIVVDPDGKIVRFTWDETDRGVKIGASRAEVQRAYSGFAAGKCTLYGPKNFADIYTDPATGRSLLAVYVDVDRGVSDFVVTGYVEDGEHCPFE